MRRTLTIVLLLAVTAGLAPAATAARTKPAARTFYVVPGAERFECALSTDPKLADPSRGCANDYEAAAEPVLGPNPTWIHALDGLPVSLDVSRPIRGTVNVDSRHLVSYFVPMGVGQARLRVTVAGVAGGKDVTVGTVTSETYTVTPDVTRYRVDFRIEPDRELAGATLTELRVGLEVLGPNAHHNFFSADGQSRLTLPLAR